MPGRIIATLPKAPPAKYLIREILLIFTVLLASAEYINAIINPAIPNITFRILKVSIS